METNDKVLLVTGSSRGIGAATALQAAGQGYAICLNYIKDESAAFGVRDNILDLGAKCIVVQADVTNEQQVTKMFKQIDTELGSITHLVNNVGILKQKMPFIDMDAERFEKVLLTNVMSHFYCSKEAIKRMAVSKGGTGGAIVNVSSRAAKSGSPFEYVDYAASKGAIDTFTIGLSKEVVLEGIRVNAVRPGLIYTDIHADGGEPNRVDRLADKLPMKRGGYPNEVANAILWLLSDEASFVTGDFINVSSGL